jgi:UDPglucose 6-dehydrogenase
MNITVLGTGSVGLVTGACLSHLGHQTICVDLGASREAAISEDGVPDWEPGLNDLLLQGFHQQRIQFSTDIPEAIREGEVVIIAVETPLLPDGRTDLTLVWKAVELIARHHDGQPLVLVQSAVPVGTTRAIQEAFQKDPHCEQLEVAYCPAFFSRGNAVRDFLQPQKIVLGVETSQAQERVTRIYRGIPCELKVLDFQSAEWIQHASRAYLAMKLSYVQMLARFRQQQGEAKDELPYQNGMGQGSFPASS